MDYSLILIILIVISALAFDFINGFHDTANAVATSISTRALSPRYAVILAATMNLLGALLFDGVAKTISGKIADPFHIANGELIILATLLSSILWNLITWYLAIPSSSSHALVGAMAGAVVASSGFGGIHLSGFTDIIKWLILTPIISFVCGYIFMTILNRVFSKSNPHKIYGRFRILQIFSAAFLSYSHGANDAQKTMGVITFSLISAGYLTENEIPLWVKLSAAVAMALGTSFGGWKIIKTVGSKIFKLTPVHGFSIDLIAAIVNIIATLNKLPISSTHVISSALLGVGSSKRFSAVKWGIAGKIITTWVITIPISAALSYIFFKLIMFL